MFSLLRHVPLDRSHTVGYIKTHENLVSTTPPPVSKMLPTQEKDLEFYALRQKPKPNASWKKSLKACGLVLSGYVLAQLEFKPAFDSVKLGVSNLCLTREFNA